MQRGPVSEFLQVSARTTLAPTAPQHDDTCDGVCLSSATIYHRVRKGAGE